MIYAPPVEEQKFLLRHVVGMAELATSEAFAEATPETVDAIVDGAGAFAAGEFAPLNRIGDEVGARWGRRRRRRRSRRRDGGCRAPRQKGAREDEAGEEPPPAATASRRSHERRTPCLGRPGSPPAS